MATTPTVDRVACPAFDTNDLTAALRLAAVHLRGLARLYPTYRILDITYEPAKVRAWVPPAKNIGAYAATTRLVSLAPTGATAVLALRVMTDVERNVLRVSGDVTAVERVSPFPCDCDPAAVEIDLDDVIDARDISHAINKVAHQLLDPFATAPAAP